MTLLEVFCERRPSAIDRALPKDCDLSTTIKGQFFYLCLILDLFSRKIVGWEVYDRESSEYASETVSRTVLKDGKNGEPVNVVLHSDNGSPMKGATMLGTLQKLGIRPSFGQQRQCLLGSALQNTEVSAGLSCSQALRQAGGGPAMGPILCPVVQRG